LNVQKQIDEQNKQVRMEQQNSLRLLKLKRNFLKVTLTVQIALCPDGEQLLESNRQREVTHEQRPLREQAADIRAPFVILIKK
jgi:hypothetical protein